MEGYCPDNKQPRQHLNNVIVIKKSNQHPAEYRKKEPEKEKKYELDYR
jgi:hypothetical protein